MLALGLAVILLPMSFHVALCQLLLFILLMLSNASDDANDDKYNKYEQD